MRILASIGILVSLYLFYIIGSTERLLLYILFALMIALFDASALLAVRDRRFLRLSIASAFYLGLSGLFFIRPKAELLSILFSPLASYAFYSTRTKLSRHAALIGLFSLLGSLYPLALALMVFSIGLLLEKPR